MLALVSDFSGYDLTQALVRPGRRDEVLRAYAAILAPPPAPAGGSGFVGGFAWQVLNEPAHFLGLAPDHYVQELLAPTYEDLKRLTPDVAVVAAAEIGNLDGIARLRNMQEAGVEAFCDRVAYHVYGRNLIPHLRGLARKPVWVTESGVVGPENHLAWHRDVLPEIKEADRQRRARLLLRPLRRRPAALPADRHRAARRAAACGCWRSPPSSWRTCVRASRRPTARRALRDPGARHPRVPRDALRPGGDRGHLLRGRVTAPWAALFALAAEAVRYPLPLAPPPAVPQGVAVADVQYAVSEQPRLVQHATARVRIGRLGYAGGFVKNQLRGLTLQTYRLDADASEENGQHEFGAAFRARHFRLGSRLLLPPEDEPHDLSAEAGARLGLDTELVASYLEEGRPRPFPSNPYREVALQLERQGDRGLELALRATRSTVPTVAGFDFHRHRLAATGARALRTGEVEAELGFERTSGRLASSEVFGAATLRAPVWSRLLVELRTRDRWEPGVSVFEHEHGVALSLHARRIVLARAGEAAARTAELARLRERAAAPTPAAATTTSRAARCGSAPASRRTARSWRKPSTRSTRPRSPSASSRSWASRRRSAATRCAASARGRTARSWARPGRSGSPGIATTRRSRSCASRTRERRPTTTSRRRPSTGTRPSRSS